MLNNCKENQDSTEGNNPQGSAGTMKLMKDVTGKVTNTSRYIMVHKDTHEYISALLNSFMTKSKSKAPDNKGKSGLAAAVNTYQSLAKLKAYYSNRSRSSISRRDFRSLQMQIAILSDEDGDRPIHVAVANEDFKFVHKLCILMMKNSISLDITNYLRQTPLHLAVMIGNAKIIQLLLNFGASPLVCDRNGNSVLHLAVKSNTDKEILQILISHPQVKNILNSMDYEGYSPLHYAVFRNNSNAVRMLHESGVDINKIDGKSGRTALIHAVLEQNIAMADLLLNCGASPQKGDYSGRSSFEMALQIANIKLIELLEKRMPFNDSLAVKEQIKPPVKCRAKITKRNQ